MTATTPQADPIASAEEEKSRIAGEMQRLSHEKDRLAQAMNRALASDPDAANTIPAMRRAMRDLDERLSILRVKEAQAAVRLASARHSEVPRKKLAYELRRSELMKPIEELRRQADDLYRETIAPLTNLIQDAIYSEGIRYNETQAASRKLREAEQALRDFLDFHRGEDEEQY